MFRFCQVLKHTNDEASNKPNNHTRGGGQGAEDREKRGQEVYVREGGKRGREAGFPRWRVAGEKGKNYTTLRNISQSKK